MNELDIKWCLENIIYAMRSGIQQDKDHLLDVTLKFLQTIKEGE